jgi:hypothetical protein
MPEGGDFVRGLSDEIQEHGHIMHTEAPQRVFHGARLAEFGPLLV